MRRGVNALLFTAALASAGCVTDSGKLDWAYQGPVLFYSAAF